MSSTYDVVNDGEHLIILKVVTKMIEMDGTVEESAEIAATLVKEAIAKHWDADAVVVIDEIYEGKK